MGVIQGSRGGEKLEKCNACGRGSACAQLLKMHTKDKHSVKLVEDNLQSDEEWGRVGVCCVRADDKLFGGKRSCGAFGDKSPFNEL